MTCEMFETSQQSFVKYNIMPIVINLYEYLINVWYDDNIQILKILTTENVFTLNQ